MTTLKSKLSFILAIFLLLGALGAVAGIVAVRNAPVVPADDGKCNHENTVVYKPARESTSCVKNGNTEGIACKDCGVVVIAAKSLPAQGHDFESTIVVEPTCTEKGTADLVCKTCSIEQTWSVPSHGHIYEDGSNECTECGSMASEGLRYTLSADGTYVIITGRGTFTGTELFIPPTIDGIPVKKIGNGAFKLDLDITSVDIPSSVEEISDYAFNGCKQLRNVVLPEGLKKIGGYGFWNCRLTDELYIPDSVEQIGRKAFGNLANISRVVIRGGLSDYCQIAEEAFVCDTITEIYVPWGRWSAGDLNDHAPWGAKNAEIVYGSLIDW